jgi:hypothetical protein
MDLKTKETAMETENFIDQARPLIVYLRGIEGCPRLPDWVDLNGYIEDNNPDNRRRYAWNPPAVTSEICMWVMEVHKHFILKRTVSPNGCISFNHGAKKWRLNHGNGSWHDTKELAFLAFLTAIAVAQGYKGDSNPTHTPRPTRNPDDGFESKGEIDAK